MTTSYKLSIGSQGRVTNPLTPTSIALKLPSIKFLASGLKMDNKDKC